MRVEHLQLCEVQTLFLSLVPIWLLVPLFRHSTIIADTFLWNLIHKIVSLYFKSNKEQKSINSLASFDEIQKTSKMVWRRTIRKYIEENTFRKFESMKQTHTKVKDIKHNAPFRRDIMYELTFISVIAQWMPGTHINSK